MTATDQHPSRLRVVHLLPLDLGRGAQNYAASLRERLADDRWEHRIVTFFRSDARSLELDDCLGVAPGRLRKIGFDPRVFLRLRRFLRAANADVVVAHGGEPFKYARFATPERTRLVYYKIGVSQVQATRGPRRLLHRFLANGADIVAGVSHETLDDAHLVMGVDRAKLRLVPNGRDPEPFIQARGRVDEALTGGERSTGPVHLIFVSQLTPGKRPDWFVDTVIDLRSDGLDVRASLVGEGPMLDELMERARAAEVELLGFRPDVPDLLARSDVFCFPSSGESEGMPGVLIEAGLAGLPTVATAVAGASTVIEHGTTGFVVPSSERQVFTESVRRLVLDDGLRAAMGSAALESCTREFTLEASVDRFRKVLVDLTPAAASS